MIVIGMMDANDFVESIVVDTVTYFLHFSWNDLAQGWTMDLRNSKNEDIVRGVSIVPNFPLLNQYRRHMQSRFEIMAVTVSQDLQKNQSIGRDGFTSGRFNMVLIPANEIKEILGAG